MKTVLNVGCGTCPIHPQFEGWKEIRLDIDPAVKPDIICDMLDLFHNIDDGSYNAVYSSHNLEHLYAHEVQVVLSQFYWALCPGGLVLIGVPNLKAVAWKVACGNLEGVLYVSPAGPIAAIDCIYGCREFTKDNPHQQHKTGFTPSTLKKKMEAVGFVNVTVETKDMNMWATGVKK